VFFGHAIPEALAPRLELALRKGVLDASAAVPERWKFQAKGDAFGTPARLDVALDATDLNSFLLFTPLGLAPGRGGSIAVEGKLVLPTRAGELPTGTFTVTRARLDLPDRPGVLATSGNVRASLGNGRLTFDEFHAVGEGSDLKVNGYVDLGRTPRTVNVAVSGPLDASLLSLAAPDIGLAGKLRLDMRANGTFDSPQLAGTVRIENGRYRMNNPPVIVDDLDGLLTFHGARGDLEARAKVRGGEAFAAGSFSVAGLALRDFRFSVQARRVSLPYPEDMRLVVDADLVATGGPAGNQVRGEVTLLRGTYTKDFDITLTDLLSRGRPAGVAAVEPWKERTTLEVRIVSSASLEVRTNVAKLTGTVDLVARGTVADPALVGQIVLDEGGRVQFRDVRYDIEAGTVTFANARGFAPIIDIRARAEVKGYDLIVSLVGTWPRIQTSFSSDPPLPDESVIALLLTGTAPSSRPESDTASSIVSVGAGIAAGAATGVLTRPTQKFFKLERFEIDPIFTGAGQLSDVRSTVGKQVTPNLLVTYSQSFDTSKQPVVQFEWRLSNNFVLRGQRDENGTYLIDLRRRQRL
jgi:translocation and assembly module TamB